MTDPKEQPTQPDDIAESQEPTAEAAEPQSENQPQDSAETAGDKTPQEVEQGLRDEIDQLNDKLLRSMADYQNLARRSQLNVQQARQDALVDVGKGLITALDHFDRALEVDPEKTSPQAILDGLTIVRDELLRALANHGIERIEVEPGDEFDPNQHEALMRTDSEGIESGNIVQQLQPGYSIQQRTIRPAQVSLAN